jgi:hypothetical protein
MREFVAAQWKECLQRNGLRTFDDFWNLKTENIEPRNERRASWSGVARFELADVSGPKHGIFIKRQENYTVRTWQFPFGAPTLRLEFQNIRRYRECGIPSLTVIYYGEHNNNDGVRRAVLVTEELIGFRSMQDYVTGWKRSGWPPRAERFKIIETVAKTLRSIHQHGMRHNSFFPKHIWLRYNYQNEIELRIIDLERTRWQPWMRAETSRDLRNLANTCMAWSRSDYVSFYKNYLGVKKLRSSDKANWAKLRAIVVEKQRIRALKRIGANS